MTNRLEIGKIFEHPKHGRVLIVEGSFIVDYGRVSNFWSWHKVDIDGNAIGEIMRGYGTEFPNPLDDMPKATQTRIAYIVWNAARTEGYITFDAGVAYEARKGAESNCFDSNGTQMKLAQAFCEIYSGHEDATKQIVVISEPPAYPGDN